MCNVQKDAESTSSQSFLSHNSGPPHMATDTALRRYETAQTRSHSIYSDIRIKFFLQVTAASEVLSTSEVFCWGNFEATSE